MSHSSQAVVGKFYRPIKKSLTTRLVYLVACALSSLILIDSLRLALNHGKHFSLLRNFTMPTIAVLSGQPTSATSWNGAAANWAVAIGTLVLALVAVFQQWLQELFVHPKLNLDVRLARPDAEKTLFNNGVDVYYFRLAVTNTGNMAAHDVQVYVSGIEREAADKSYKPVERFMPMALIWAHMGSPTKPHLLPNMPRSFCDLGHISDPARKAGTFEALPEVAPDATVLALDLEVKPNSKGYLLGPGTYRLSLKVAASNCPPRDYILEAVVRGQWFADEDKMLSDGIGLRIL
jgi:hypothetical protein